jgi:hypothetical protein
MELNVCHFGDVMVQARMAQSLVASWGARGGAAVALEDVDDAEDGVDGRVGDDAVAEAYPRGDPRLKPRAATLFLTGGEARA